MKNEAIKNDMKRRIENMNELTRERVLNPERIVLSAILDELIHNIDFQQRKVKRLFTTSQNYGQSRYTKDLACKIWHDWQIAKAALTRLQGRYRIVLEMLARS